MWPACAMGGRMALPTDAAVARCMGGVWGLGSRCLRLTITAGCSRRAGGLLRPGWARSKPCALSPTGPAGLRRHHGRRRLAAVQEAARQVRRSLARARSSCARAALSPSHPLPPFHDPAVTSPRAPCSRWRSRTSWRVAAAGVVVGGGAPPACQSIAEPAPAPRCPQTYKHAVIEPGPKLNLVIGPNGGCWRLLGSGGRPPPARPLVAFHSGPAREGACRPTCLRSQLRASSPPRARAAAQAPASRAWSAPSAWAWRARRSCWGAPRTCRRLCGMARAAAGLRSRWPAATRCAPTWCVCASVCVWRARAGCRPRPAGDGVGAPAGRHAAACLCCRAPWQPAACCTRRAARSLPLAASCRTPAFRRSDARPPQTAADVHARTCLQRPHPRRCRAPCRRSGARSPRTATARCGPSTARRRA